jgi:hypothetical protein
MLVSLFRLFFYIKYGGELLKRNVDRLSTTQRYIREGREPQILHDQRLISCSNIQHHTWNDLSSLSAIFCGSFSLCCHFSVTPVIPRWYPPLSLSPLSLFLPLIHSLFPAFTSRPFLSDNSTWLEQRHPSERETQRMKNISFSNSIYGKRQQIFESSEQFSVIYSSKSSLIRE